MSSNDVESQCSERMVPESAHARTFWEHVERYRFSTSFVRGKHVLDIACGEGFGAAGLARGGAASVIGVDISSDACENARRKYGLDARVGDAQAIPLADRSVDVVTSFETIEHLTDPAAFIRECARVLVPEGVLIVSTPNRPVYSPKGLSNPYHQTEFDEREFVDLLRTCFDSVRLFTQYPQNASPLSLRSLAAERSPWMRIKGFWRLSSWLCAAIRPHLSAEVRAMADKLIVRREVFPASLLNPYLVRPYAKRSGEKPYYLVAVAERVNPMAHPELDSAAHLASASSTRRSN